MQEKDETEVKLREVWGGERRGIELNFLRNVRLGKKEEEGIRNGDK